MKAHAILDPEKKAKMREELEALSTSCREDDIKLISQIDMLKIIHRVLPVNLSQSCMEHCLNTRKYIHLLVVCNALHNVEIQKEKRQAAIWMS
jgi:hypothetical protein